MSLFDQIESRDFAAGIVIMSGFRILLVILEDSEIEQKLIADLRDSPENQEAVYQRILELLPANEHPDYRSPHDPALTGYLYALRQVNPELALKAAEAVRQKDDLFWAYRLAVHIAQEPAPDHSA